MKMTQEKIHLEYEKIMYHKTAIIHLLDKIGAELVIYKQSVLTQIK